MASSPSGISAHRADAAGGERVGQSGDMVGDGTGSEEHVTVHEQRLGPSEDVVQRGPGRWAIGVEPGRLQWRHVRVGDSPAQAFLARTISVNVSVTTGSPAASIHSTSRT